MSVLLFLVLFLSAGQPVRVQLTTGGHQHDLSFYEIFQGTTDLAVTVNPHPSAYRRDLRKFADVLVLYDLSDVDDEQQRGNLRSFLESGGGLVVLHHALADNWRWQWWYEEVVGGRFLMGQDGEMLRSRAKAGEVINARPVVTHPVLNGVGEIRFPDETYQGMWHSPRTQVLMETDHPGNDRPVAWVGPWKKSRVVVIQLGHGPESHRDPGYRRLVLNAIRWAADGERRPGS